MNRAGHGMPMLAGMSRADLEQWAREQGEPAFRGRQLADWMFHRLELDPREMTSLPQSLRELAANLLAAPAGRVEAADVAEDGTEKLLVRLADGQSVEMVLIPAGERMTFCLSTQVGCPVRCRFCASGAEGLVRNLQAGEIVEELVFGARRIGRLPDNLVFMGIGEGLLNLDELLRAIALIVSPEGFGMSPRRLTVSTSGIVPGIRRLAEFGRELTLAVSLHAVNDELRARLSPDGVRYPVREILAAMDEYRERAGRMVTLEYTLLDGVNDSPADARELARIGREHHAKINLIPYNATDAAFRRPPRRVMEEFFRTVEQCGGRVTMRQERGSSRTAACGQLRRRHAEKRETSSECE